MLLAKLQSCRLHLLVFSIVFLLSITVNGQELENETTSYKNLIELRHDNDFLLFTDRYYSTGNYIGWRTQLENIGSGDDQFQYRLLLQQEIFTPADLLELDFTVFDRPFAGFAGITNGLSLTNDSRIIDVQLTLGVTGPYSGGERLQSAFHENVVEGRIATWLAQIRTAAVGNVYFTYTREWQWEPNPFSVHVAWNRKFALGNRDIYLQPEAAFYFGKRDSLRKTSAYNQIGSTQNELFFAVRVAYRYVYQDALLEGDLIGDASLFLIKPHRNLFLYDFEFYTRMKRNRIKFTYNYQSARTRRTFAHTYFTISLSRVF